MARGKWILALAALCVAGMGANAMDIGESVPELKLDYQLNEVTFAIDAKGKDENAEKRYILLDFFGSYWPSSRESAEILNAIQQEYAGKPLQVVAVSGEPLDTLKKFVENQAAELRIGVAHDESNLLAAQVIPGNLLLPVCAILNGRGRLIWLGNLNEVPQALRQIYSGTYDENQRRKLLPLYNELSSALRGGSVTEVAAITEKMLDLDPANAAAAEARLFIHETNGEPEKAWAFLGRRLTKARKDSLWYMLCVGFGARNPQYAEDALKLAKLYIVNVPDAPESDAITMAWELATGYSFNVEAWNVADQLLKTAKTSTWRVDATRALIAYRRCDKVEALRLQTQAVAAAERAKVNAAQLAELKRIETFFQQLQ